MHKRTAHAAYGTTLTLPGMYGILIADTEGARLAGCVVGCVTLLTVAAGAGPLAGAVVRSLTGVMVGAEVAGTSHPTFANACSACSSEMCPAHASLALSSSAWCVCCSGCCAGAPLQTTSLQSQPSVLVASRLLLLQLLPVLLHARLLRLVSTEPPTDT